MGSRAETLPWPAFLAAATRDRGVASLAVIAEAGAEPDSCWLPPTDREPLFLIYSITKTFIATLVLQLRDAGALSLDDPLARWFPRVPHANRIVLRRLLDHTSGIPDYGSAPAYHENVRRTPSDPWTFERFAAETFERGLLFEPGQGWAYSNPGYMLLKHIAEQVGDRSFRDLVADRICTPLALRRTYVAESTADLAALAPAMSSALSPNGAPRDVRAHYHPGWVSHGVIASTTSDVARFIDALLRGELLSNESVAEMTDVVTLPNDASDSPSPPTSPARVVTPSYGLGVMGDPDSPWGLAVGHNGGGPGYAGSVFHTPDLGGATACALGAFEEFGAMELVLDVFDSLAARRSR